MALRQLGSARLRHAARGRAGFVALACVLYLAAGVATTWPAVRHAGSSFLAGGAPGHGEAAPGDHLQTAYHLWLVGHQLEHGHAPWRDPYSFRPESTPQPNYPGWPFGLAVAAVVSIPLSGQVHLALGAVPFVCAYALVRARERRVGAAVGAIVVGAVTAGLLVKVTTIDRSHLATGRSLDAVAQYSAGWGDLVHRHEGASFERFVFLGWATPLLAAAGLVLLWRSRRGLAAVLGLGAVV